MVIKQPNRVHALLLFVMLASACSSKSSDQPKSAPDKRFDELVEYLSTPQYGPVRAITGKAMFGFEVSDIALCHAPRKKCTLPINVDGSEQLCWVVASGEANKALASQPYASRDWQGEFWIEGHGRIAVRPGMFGHLGGYTCQVELTKIDVIEKGPPWILGPPPPPSK